MINNKKEGARFDYLIVYLLRTFISGITVGGLVCYTFP